MSAHGDDRPYTTEEIAQTLQACDLRTRVAIFLLCSSGMRIEASHSLQICDLTPVNFRNTTVYRIQVYARTRDSYYTFCNTECYNVIKNYYLKDRERCGEVLKDKNSSMQRIPLPLTLLGLSPTETLNTLSVAL